MSLLQHAISALSKTHFIGLAQPLLQLVHNYQQLVVLAVVVQPVDYNANTLEYGSNC